MKSYLAEIRKARGITQIEMAQRIGRSISSYQKYEYGDVKIPMKYRKMIAEVVGMEERELFPENENLTPGEMDLVSYYRGAEESVKEIVMELLRAHQKS